MLVRSIGRAAAGHHPAGLVEHQVADGEHRRRGRGGPPAQRLHPGHQLLEGERLGQVVVGAELQPLDPVGDRAARGEHQHPGQRAGRDQRRADLVAVHAGQVPVEHDDVVAGHVGHLVALQTVVGDVHRHALAPQPARDRVAEVPLVFHHQHAHRRPPLPTPAGDYSLARRV